MDRLIPALLLAILATAAVPACAWAQAQPSLSPEDEISPRQMQTAPSAQPTARPKKTQRSIAPAAQLAPAAGSDPAAHPAPATAAAAPAAAAAPKPAPAAHAIACSGMFAKDSSHVLLAETFAKDIEYGAVAGPDGTSLNASILFGKDPKRRLEVLWQNEETRSVTSLIVIGGQSQWTAPKGLRLGLALAALEKLNGKPFQLSGFDQPDGGSVTDWQGGALALLPGGCRVGIRLAPDRKASPDTLTAAAGKEFSSSDAAMRAAKPVISEIILGYPQ